MVLPESLIAFAQIAAWILAVAILLRTGMGMAQQTIRASRWRTLRLLVFITITGAVAGIAQLAIERHDRHFDLTHNQAYTADAAALEVVQSLPEQVQIIYFGHDDDPAVARLRVILQDFARRQPLLSVEITDPDKNPLLARRHGVDFYNVAVVEAAGRRVLAQTTNEIDIALAIQKARGEIQTTLCFTTGHGEAEINNEEFHTHVESLGGGEHAGHHHGHAHIPVVKTTAHGIGRLRRSLDALGYVSRTINLTTEGAQLSGCDVVSVTQPKYPFAPDEIAALKSVLDDGASLLAFFDLGYEVDVWQDLFASQGMRLNNNLVTDEDQNHAGDKEALAITNYPSHRITKDIAMTVFPGVRTISLSKSDDLSEALVAASSSSRAHGLEQADDLHYHVHPTAQDETREARVIVALREASSGQGRFLLAGDADFLTNSYFPYLSNSALALSIFHWASGEQTAYQLEPRMPVYESLILSQEQMTALFGTLVFGLPGLVLLFGLVVWWRNK